MTCKGAVILAAERQRRGSMHNALRAAATTWPGAMAGRQLCWSAPPSLRLHEADVIKAGPQEIIAAGTDWRFLDELKRELKT